MLSYFLLTKYKVIPIFIKISLLFACIISAVLNILTHPVGAPDIFNYIINCKMAYFYHLNPYIHTFREYFKYDPLIGYTTLSHSTLPYGPLWLLLCYISFHISGFSSILSMLLCYKSFNFAFLIFTALIIYRYEEKDKKWVSLYLYLLNPLILFEGVVNGHNDLIMTFFFIYSIFKLRSNSFFTLPLFTLGSMVKVFILPLLPLFLIEMVRRKWPINKIIASCLLSVFIAICLFIPFRDKNVIKGMIGGMNSYHETRGLSTYGVIRTYMKRNAIEGLSYVKIIWGFIFILFLIAEIFFIKGRVEDRAVDILLFFLINISLLYPWYLIPVFTLLSVSEDKRGLLYLFTGTFTGMLFYPLSVFLWRFIINTSNSTAFLSLSVIMILPVIIFFIFRILRISNKAVTT
ncbi:MAG: hypothetical protein ABRQ38_00880 [Candidatus Eremiobacterota bacterium]